MNKGFSRCFKGGLLIFVLFELIDHIVTVPDWIAIPMCVISVILLMISAAYSGWRLGNHIKAK